MDFDITISSSWSLGLGLEPRTRVDCPPVETTKDQALPDEDQSLDAQSTPVPQLTSEPLPSLSHVAHTLRLQKYQRRHRQHLQSQLRALEVACTRTVRLTSIARVVQRILAECIRLEDKDSFATLFSAFQDVREGCHRLATESAGSDGVEPVESLDGSCSFLDRLPEPSHVTVLNLLTAVRHNGDFIADRLATLNPKELGCLLPERATVRSTESIFGHANRPSSRTYAYPGPTIDGHAALMTSEAFGSPLETLIHCVSSVADGRLSNDSRALNVWSTVCARAIIGQSLGSEKLVPSLLDIWACASEWPGRHRLGLWIRQTLQKGSFLIEQPVKQPFRIRVEGRPETSAEDATRMDDFYSLASNELLDLIADPQGASVIPEPVLKMCRAIWTKLQPHPGLQRAFPHFVLTRWLFSSFFMEAVTLPEVRCTPTMSWTMLTVLRISV